MTKEEKLSRLTNRGTRYELIAQHGGTRILIMYSRNTGRHAMMECVRKHGQALIDAMRVSDDARIVFLKPAERGATIGEWTIRFSGRTQRQAIIEGEYLWIGEPSTVQTVRTESMVQA